MLSAMQLLVQQLPQVAATAMEKVVTLTTGRFTNLFSAAALVEYAALWPC